MPKIVDSRKFPLRSSNVALVEEDSYTLSQPYTARIGTKCKNPLPPMQHSNYARETSSNPRFSAWLRGEYPTALVPSRNGRQCQASVLGDLPRARLDRFYLLLSAVYRTASNARQQTLCRSL